MRVVQPEGGKGSLKWIQRAIECNPAFLQPDGVPPIEWLSPRREDEFAEYRDTSFLKLVGCEKLAPQLREFWPSRGPQWDALGIADGMPVLLEAKAHVREMFSPACGASGKSRDMILKAFEKVREDLGVVGNTDWMKSFYQVANRIAHLWWLHENKVNAHLVFAGFLQDAEMNGPSWPETWKAATDTAFHALGLGGRHHLSGFIHHVYPDVTEL